MPREQEEFKSAVELILKAVMFENWLRFYFLVEENGENENDDPKLRLELPKKSLEQIELRYPDLLPLAESLNGKLVDFESSRNAILAFVLDHLDGSKLKRGMAQTVFSSSAFQIRMQMFHTWVQLHEDQLDERFLDFATWQKLFEEWAKTPAALELAGRLLRSPAG